MNSNRMIVMSKAIDTNGNLVDKPDTVFPLADDSKEIRGIGMPLTVDIAREAVNEFCDLFEKASDFVTAIDLMDGIVTANAKDVPGFNALKKLMNPAKFIVSGVFGKEIIHQVLAQRNCEGIRYNLCFINGELSILLMGVDDTTKDGDTQTTSAPLFSKVIRGDEPVDLTGSNQPLIPEVRTKALRFEELRALVNQKEQVSAAPAGRKFTDVLFAPLKDGNTF